MSEGVAAESAHPFGFIERKGYQVSLGGAGEVLLATPTGVETVLYSITRNRRLMKATYDLIVTNVDHRGRVRIQPVKLAKDAKEPDGAVALSIRFDEDVKHGYVPGQRIKITLEG